MKRLLLLILLQLAVFSPAHAQGGPTGNINLFLGGKTLNDEDWLAYEHGESGLLIDIGHDSWPINIAIDMLHSSGDFAGLAYSPYTGIVYVEEEVITREFDIGVRHYFDVSPVMHPYIGGGLALVSLEADWYIDPGIVASDKGNGSGLWLNGGIIWTFNAFNVGLDIRATMADVDLDIGNYEGGGGHAGLLLGYHW